ncbi:MAG: anhydro-N-acetylmuramic acid kinase [Gammaproteobacteria bacterium]|nr:anhydro-N-acetylmuramic acid kinase [Gammaproteobacteria bacterium]MDH5594966.1 anhydro-N-acetylmuramic acid kinase [Gammaproteobacteria bacterium]
MSELYIGLMSGTSMDALDAVLVDFSTTPMKLIASNTFPISKDIKEKLVALCTPGDDEIDRMSQLDNQLGLLFADAVNTLLNTANISNKQINAIGSHGQTIRHMPTGNYPYTLQIGNPSVISEQTGITTIADFRRRDMAAGGQGAPLAPAFHNAVFRSEHQDRIALNIGGIANITILPADKSKPVTGFDTGPGNGLMDVWCLQYQNEPFDEEGQWAATGKVQDNLLKQFLADPYFKMASPKSTGREYFNPDWLDQFSEIKNAKPEDVQATLCALTVESIAQDIEHSGASQEVIVCGGGAHNNYLMGQLSKRLSGCQIKSSAALGIEPDWIEAIAFAWLARQTRNNLPGNIASVTGAQHDAVLGAIYPA